MTGWKSTSPWVSPVLAWVAVLVVTSACSPRSRPAAAPTADYNTLTAVELSQRPFYSVYEAVQSLRPNWLSTRGGSSEIQVYVDDNHVGGLEILKMIRIPSVERVRHIDGIQAVARYGAGHDSGVILVSTRASGR